MTIDPVMLLALTVGGGLVLACVWMVILELRR